MTATIEATRAAGGDALPAPFSGRRATLVFFILVAASVPWRADTIFAGGADPIVIAKAMLTVIGVAIAWNERRRSIDPPELAAAPFVFLGAFLSITLFGAWASGLLVVSAILVARIVLLAAAVTLVVRAVGSRAAVRSLFTAMASVAILAAITNISSFGSGRLGGGVPPIHPNELALLASLPAIGLGWLYLRQRATSTQVALLLVLLGIVWATGSRTSLGVTLLALAVMLPFFRRPSRGQIVVGLLALCLAAYVATATDFIDAFFLRGGTENVTSFSSRTIAWSAAFDYSDDAWIEWMGSGIAMREVPVEGQYWQTQLLDSTWISALVQAGRAGVAVLAIWVLWLASTVTRYRSDEAALALALLVALGFRSITESGLVDSTSVFIAFWVLCLSGAAATCERRAGPAGSPQSGDAALTG